MLGFVGYFLIRQKSRSVSPAAFSEDMTSRERSLEKQKSIKEKPSEKRSSK